MEDLIHHILQSANAKVDQNNPFFHILRHIEDVLQEEVGKECTQPQPPSPLKKPSNTSTSKTIPTDIYRDGARLHVFMDLPGVTKSDISIEMTTNNVLSVSVEKKAPIIPSNEECMLKERCFGYLHKNVQLPKYVDRTNIAAKYDNGVLHIICHQKLEAETKQKIIVE